MTDWAENARRMTVAQLHRELSRVLEVGGGNKPIFAGDFDVTGLMWIADNSTQVFTPEDAEGVLLEYS